MVAERPTQSRGSTVTLAGRVAHCGEQIVTGAELGEPSAEVAVNRVGVLAQLLAEVIEGLKQISHRWLPGGPGAILSIYGDWPPARRTTHIRRARETGTPFPQGTPVWA